MPGKDGYDGSGGSGDGSILIGDSLVFVVDILDIDYAKPYGTPVAPKAGLPTVAVDANGVPSVTINSATAAPTATVIEPLIAGSGTRKVAATDSIAVHYRMYSWKTGELIDDKFADPDSGTCPTPSLQRGAGQPAPGLAHHARLSAGQRLPVRQPHARGGGRRHGRVRRCSDVRPAQPVTSSDHRTEGAPMNFEKVVFGFFVLLAATLNFGFVTGEIGNPSQRA